MGLLGAFYSLASSINKFKGKETSNDNIEGAVSDYLPELSLTMDDKELITLTKNWEKGWMSSKTRANWIKQVEDNENYWRGKQFNKLELEALRPLVDNLVFEGTETFLPAATRQNPEPLVELRATEVKSDINEKYTEIIRDRLADWADDVKLRLKIKKAGRHWFLSLIGVAKMGWDLTNNRPGLKIIRPKKLILDPEGVTDEDGYQGKYVGEYRKMEASILAKIIEKEPTASTAKAEIDAVSKGDMGTDIQFIEWWTTEYMCWTLNETVLLKKKNPHWNWEEKPEESASPVTPESEAPNTAEKSPEAPGETSEAEADKPQTAGGEPSTEGMPQTPDENASETTPEPKKTGNNHFPSPEMPYIFLSIFNLGSTPVDETSLVTQILPQQDLVNKRNKQIDKNADGMNNGVVVSEERSGLTKDEAKGVTQALAKGGTVVIPTGSAQDAVYRMPANALPTDVYNNLNDNRNRFRQILGIQGISPAGLKNEDTVRGKIMVRGLDTDRIGGGVTEYFEQFADKIFNWGVQLMYVYDDMFANNPSAKLPKIKVSVKEGSLLPKDATTKANQAIELAGAGKMSLIDLYKALQYPNPEEMAANLWLEANAPELVFKDDQRVQQALQMIAAKKTGIKPPSESISFKDLPPDGKVQMAEQAGIKLNPAVVATHDAIKETPAPPAQRSDLSQVSVPK